MADTYETALLRFGSLDCPGRLPNVAQKQNLQSVPLLQQDIFQVGKFKTEVMAAIALYLSK